MQELITWHEVAQEMPDSDETVLGFNAAWSDPCWGCYHDGETWRALEGERLYPASPNVIEDAHEPTHWAKWPFGPKADDKVTRCAGDKVKGGAR